VQPFFTNITSIFINQKNKNDMKKIYILASLFLGFTFTSNAQLLLDENFDYGSSAGSLTTTSGGNWVNHSGTAGTLAYQTSSLSMTSYPSSGVGGSALVDPTQTEDANRSFSNVNSGVIYMSALVNVESATTENYIWHFKHNTSATNFTCRVYAKDESGNLKFGIREAAEATTTYAAGNFSFNTTYLIVAKYDFSSGRASLFVLTSVVGSEPASDASSDTGANATQLDQVGLRQSNSGGSVKATVDGIRVANTWADLMAASASPTVNFASASLSKDEASGTTTVTINISPAPAGAETFDVTIADNTATYTNDYTTNPAGTSTFTLNVAASATSVSFDVIVVDDTDQESSEDFTATISNPSSGLTIGSTNIMTFTITDNDSQVVTTPIKDVQATTSGDASDKVGQSVTIGGRVSAIKTGNGFFIQDAPGAWNGIYIYDLGANTVVRGDSVIVTGTVTEFAPGSSAEKSTQITTLTAFSNKGSNTPHATTSLSTNAVNDEMYEGVLVTVTNGSVNSTLNGFGEFIINDGSGDAMIDDFLYLITPAPLSGEVYTVTGVVAHNFGDYKILPRDASDIVKGTSTGVTKVDSESVSIYPNPSNGIVNVDVKGNATIEVYNSLGQMVLNTTSKTFELASGVYAVRVNTNNGTASKNIIVE
jgi:hypothetical protein